MIEGIIHKLLGGFYYVATDDGILETRARGLFRNEDVKPLVGDHVSVEIDPLDGHKGTIMKVHKRRTKLVRPAVANVDRALIVFALNNPKPNIHLLDKMLIMCEMSGIEPLICFNKIDLDETGEGQAEMLKIYEESHYEVIFTSPHVEESLQALRDALNGHISVVAGPSGVGKSTLLNAIMPGLKLNTGEISQKIKRGKHTTRHTELILLPGGGFVLDTPGFTSLELSDLSHGDIKHMMPEIVRHQEGCRFSDCNHINEPACAVIAALDAGEIHFSRYQSYKMLYVQLENDRRRQSW